MFVERDVPYQCPTFSHSQGHGTHGQAARDLRLWWHARRDELLCTGALCSWNNVVAYVSINNIYHWYGPPGTVWCKCDGWCYLSPQPSCLCWRQVEVVVVEEPLPPPPCFSPPATSWSPCPPGDVLRRSHCPKHTEHVDLGEPHKRMEPSLQRTPLVFG